MDVEMPSVEVSRKRTASSTGKSEGGVKKQKLSNIRKVSVPVHRLVEKKNY